MLGRLQKLLPFLLGGIIVAVLLLVLIHPAGTVSAGVGEGAGLEMAKTVSADGSCGVTDVLTITWNTSVTYCYTATNTGDVTLTTHILTDTVLISILDGFPYDLAPQATWAVTATFDPPDVPGPLENCALWTARSAAGDSAQAGDCATITIRAPTTVTVSRFEGMTTDVGPVIWVLVGFGIVVGWLLRK